MATKSYQASETSTVWTDATTGGDKLMDMAALAAGSLVMGAYLDLGVSPRADWYEIVILIDTFIVAGSPTNPPFDVFISQSNSTTGFDGQPTTDPTDIAEGTITLEQARNCKFVGFFNLTSVSLGDILQARFLVKLTSRYVSPILYNGTSGTAQNVGDAHKITLTPIPQESQ